MIAGSLSSEGALGSAGGRAEAGADVRCDHCRLPVPAGLFEPEAKEQFCCSSCRAVHQMIRGSGLEQYYRVREAAVDASARAPARTTARRYEEMDDATFRSLHCRERKDGLVATELALEGIHCAACVWLVERLPLVADGVIESRLNLSTGILRVAWDEGRIPLSAVARTLDSLGYPAHAARGVSARALHRAEDRRFLARVAVAGAIAGNVMLMALALYAGMFGQMEATFRELFRWLSMGLGLLSLAWPGRLFLRSAVAALRTRTPHLDIPIALGLSAAAVAGTVNTLRGAGEIYFDSLTVLVFLLLVGRWIQQRQTRRAADALELLYSLTPMRAAVVEDGVDGDRLREVPSEALAAGMIVHVLAGESIPADGVVVRGASMVDPAILTGESVPQPVGVGDAVAAGTVNVGSAVRVRVTAAGSETRVARLMRSVEEAGRERTRLIAMADRLAGWFVLAVTGLAGLTAGLWAFIEPGAAIGNATALLIVTCPCALALATPLALTAAIGRAARIGILIKGGDAIEKVAGAGTLLIDKTGTLTEGRMRIARWVGDESIRGIVAAVESQCSHPIAHALAAGAEPAESGPIAVRQHPGRGVAAEVDGRAMLIGSRALLSGADVAIPDWGSAAEEELAGETLTPVFIALDGRLAALAGVGDPVREDAAASLEWLRRRGWRVRILSGDHPEVVRRTAAALGVAEEDALGGASPEEKRAVVEGIAGEGRVVMVGDGVNDAAAMARADVGVAVHGGAEASLAAADVYLGRPGLAGLASLVDGARRTVGVIRLNLGISLAYNALTAGLCLAGQIHPLVAAVLMPVSSLTVLTLSFRRRTFATEGAR